MTDSTEGWGEIPPDLPVAPLQSIDLALLKTGDSCEVQRLLEACRSHGIFYLNLEEQEEELSPIVTALYELTRELYNLPLEEKLTYDVDKLCRFKCNGYKPVGRNFGGLNGKRDGFETYAIPKNGLLCLENHGFAHPPIIDAYIDRLREFTKTIYTMADTINESLTTALELPPSANLKLFHRLDAQAPDIIRLLKYEKQPIEQRGMPHAAHTDLGTLTFLFTRQPGLQIRTRGSEEWTWVPPMKNHAIVNLGDAMSLLTNGYLRSCVHRVGPLPDQAMPTRYSFAYMIRPEYETVLAAPQTSCIPPRDMEQPVLTSAQWLEKKFGVLRLESRPQDQDWVMTGFA